MKCCVFMEERHFSCFSFYFFLLYFHEYIITLRAYEMNMTKTHEHGLPASAKWKILT